MGQVSPIKDKKWAVPLPCLQSLAITFFFGGGGGGGDIFHHSPLALLACPFHPLQSTSDNSNLKGKSKKGSS